MGAFLDGLARSLARGTSRKDFLKLAGGAALVLLAGPVSPAAAKKNKGGNNCPTGLTACPASPPADAGPTAEKKNKRGSTVCTNLNSDPNNCGACGNKCTAGQNCGGGKCCPTGQANCSGVCAQIQNDVNNCGSCGVKCAAGQNCVAGTCAAGNCPSGQKRCGTVCQQCCADADCTGGATCTNGACTGGSCPIQVSRPSPENRRDEPGDPPLTAQFATQSTFNGQPLKLEIASTDDRNGGLTTHALFSLGGASLLQVDSRAVGGGTETTFDYGAAFGGIDKAVCTSDGSLIRCVVDGRKTLPFPPGTDPSKIAFEDGKPPPTLTGDAALAQAIGGIAAQAKQNTAGCTPKARPDSPEPAGRLDACRDCENECGVTADICTAAALAGCVGITIVTLGIGAASCGSASLCVSNGIRCLKACTDPGSACCPQKCPVSDACCEKTDRCVAVDGNLPNQPRCCPSGQLLCRNATLCCAPNEVCLGDSVCCPSGVVACKGRCCRQGEVCTASGACCPPGIASCGTACCQAGEVCTPNGACCPAGSTASCGTEELADGRIVPICCKKGEACRQVDTQIIGGIVPIPVFACCGVNNTICGGRCCDSTAPCLNGACCDPPVARPCGNVCCPGLAGCCNGKCCAVGQSCAAGNTCCNTLDICPGSNVCCPGGRVCCNGVCCPTGQGCINGACATPSTGRIACPKIAGFNYPDTCPVGTPGRDPFDVCCTNGTCCASGSCCPDALPISAPNGCCPAGSECCSGGTGPDFCSANCLKAPAGGAGRPGQ